MCLHFDFIFDDEGFAVGRLLMAGWGSDYRCKHYRAPPPATSNIFISRKHYHFDYWWLFYRFSSDFKHFRLSIFISLFISCWYAVWCRCDAFSMMPCRCDTPRLMCRNIFCRWQISMPWLLFHYREDVSRWKHFIIAISFHIDALRCRWCIILCWHFSRYFRWPCSWLFRCRRGDDELRCATPTLMSQPMPTPRWRRCRYDYVHGWCAMMSAGPMTNIDDTFLCRAIWLFRLLPPMSWFSADDVKWFLGQPKISLDAVFHWSFLSSSIDFLFDVAFSFLDFLIDGAFWFLSTFSSLRWWLRHWWCRLLRQTCHEDSRWWRCSRHYYELMIIFIITPPMPRTLRWERPAKYFHYAIDDDISATNMQPMTIYSRHYVHDDIISPMPLRHYYYFSWCTFSRCLQDITRFLSIIFFGRR